MGVLLALTPTIAQHFDARRVPDDKVGLATRGQCRAFARTRGGKVIVIEADRRFAGANQAADHDRVEARAFVDDVEAGDVARDIVEIDNILGRKLLGGDDADARRSVLDGLVAALVRRHDDRGRTVVFSGRGGRTGTLGGGGHMPDPACDVNDKVRKGQVLVELDSAKLRDQVARFLAREVEPHADQWEEQGFVPREVLRRMGQAGLFGLMYEDAYGGAEGDALTNLVFAEALSQSTYAGFIITVLVHTDMASPHLHHAGTTAQKEKYLKKVIAGELITAVGITDTSLADDAEMTIDIDTAGTGAKGLKVCLIGYQT